MLVVVIVMRGVRMALVHVIDVSLALHARVPAPWSVDVTGVRVLRVSAVLGACHGSSLLC